jgi:hypothetical protein
LINPARGSQQGTGFGSTGRMMGGALAGVASTVHGNGIKRIHDQTDYALWEFYYDPTKDKTVMMQGQQPINTPGLGNAAPGAPAAAPAQNPGAAQPTNQPPATPDASDLPIPAGQPGGPPAPIEPQ